MLQGSENMEQMYFSLVFPLSTTKKSGRYMQKKTPEDSEMWGEKGTLARDLRIEGMTW